MNIILLDTNDFTGNSKVSIRDRRAEHIINVLHAKSGQCLKVGMINGNIRHGTCISTNKNCVEIEVDNFNILPPPPLPVTLIVAMQRPKTMKKIIQSATAMGVKKIFIIETWKVEKSYWTSPLLTQEKLEEQLRLGLEQSGDTIMPQITIKKRFKPFVEDELPTITAGSLGLVAHPDSTMKCPHQIDGQITVAVGPEGGFTEYEINKMSDIGLKPVTLGIRTLRSEFAVTALLAKLT
jgi:16S rRNA (uracil1498-N3)-methyltransferase